MGESVENRNENKRKYELSVNNIICIIRVMPIRFIINGKISDRTHTHTKRKLCACICEYKVITLHLRPFRHTVAPLNGLPLQWHIPSKLLIISLIMILHIS